MDIIKINVPEGFDPGWEMEGYVSAASLFRRCVMLRLLVENAKLRGDHSRALKRAYDLGWVTSSLKAMCMKRYHYAEYNVVGAITEEAARIFRLENQE
jgi:hypothetical protein